MLSRFTVSFEDGSYLRVVGRVEVPGYEQAQVVVTAVDDVQVGREIVVW